MKPTPRCVYTDLDKFEIYLASSSIFIKCRSFFTVVVSSQGCIRVWPEFRLVKLLSLTLIKGIGVTSC